MKRQVHTINAEGKILGRLASEIAFLLRGKNKVSFVPHLDEGDIVKVENAEKIVLTGKKAEQKKYYRYTGYPGGLKETKFKELFEKNPQEVLRRAVYNMLPKNKLQDKMIKRLQFINK